MSELLTNYKTAESVSPKHPDKLCDRISDAILDSCLAQDKDSRVAIETVGGHGKIFIVGEITSSANLDVEYIVKRIVGNIDVETRIVKQSQEIASGVNIGGAGDQGIMVGYACNETEDLIPLETLLARNLNQYIFKNFPYDGKTQITLKNQKIESIVASFQKSNTSDLTELVLNWISDKNKFLSSVKPNLHINPAGEWQVGGFDADSGLTGRKLVVDNYGPRIPIGGGCFSGKDPSKVDRSAAYAARQIAIDYLIKNKAKEVYCYLAYAIGFDQPLESIVVIDGKQKEINGYDLSPNGIINWLNLKNPIYEKSAEYGHFGHKSFNWEKR